MKSRTAQITGWGIAVLLVVFMVSPVYSGYVVKAQAQSGLPVNPPVDSNAIQMIFGTFSIVISGGVATRGAN